MSDPSGELRVAALAALKADAGVTSAFGGNPVRIYTNAPVNVPGPYIIIQTASVAPYLAECLDGAETELTVDTWSSPEVADPMGQAQALGAAAQAALCAIETLPSHRITAALPARITYLIDPSDQRTAHGVVAVAFSTDPL